MNSALVTPISQQKPVSPKSDLKWCFYNSPVGLLRLTASGKGLVQLAFLPEDQKPPRSPESASDILRQTETELSRYFTRKLREFTVPLDLRGTDFQIRVWQALLTIPLGETCSYSDIAEQIGSPNAVRAVGLANSQNPVAIIVPCHRVIGKDGSLVGYGGGLWRKTKLLELERISYH